MSKPGTESQLETHTGKLSEHVHGESNGSVTSTAGQFSPAEVHSPLRLELLAHFNLEVQMDFTQFNEVGGLRVNQLTDVGKNDCC